MHMRALRMIDRFRTSQTVTVLIKRNSYHISL